jgi:Flp pilus assembly pilin Flp
MTAPRFWQEEDGQDIIEYSLLMVFIVIACMSLFGSGQPAIRALWGANQNRLAEASTAIAGN